MRKRVARHVDSCEVCADRRRVMVSPFALLAAVPLLPAPLWLRDRVMDGVQLAGYDLPPDSGDLDDLDDLGRTSTTCSTVRRGGDTDPEGGETAPAAAAARTVSKQRLRVVAAAAAVLALLVVAGAVAYWGNEATTGEPLGLDLPAPPAQQSATGSGTSGSAPGSSGTLSASPADDIVTTTDDGGADPADAGVITTTTTRPDGPPPDGPPDPPDPPGDTTRPVIAGESASNPRIFTMRCEEPTSSTVSATITDDSRRSPPP